MLDFQPDELDALTAMLPSGRDRASGGKEFAPGSAPAATVDTIPGDATTTAVLTPGGYILATIDTNGDHDWFGITLVAGQTYTISTILTGGLSDSVLDLRDSTGTLLISNDDAIQNSSFTFSEITYTAATSGTYFVDASGFGSATGDFYLTVSAPTADAVAGSSATTATIAIGAVANGQMDALGDHDWYAVQLTAGQTYVFDTQPTGAATDFDTVLMVRNSAGTLLGYNDDSTGTYSRVRFTAPTTGTFYLDVGAWGNNAASGAFKLGAAVAPPLALYTNDEIATQLTTTYWGGSSRHFNVTPGGTLTVNVTALTADGINLAREALKLWTDATGIVFNEVATGGQITFDDNQAGAFSSSSTSGGLIVHSDVNVSTDWLTTSGITLRSYSFQTYVHEIGHALGLGHAGNYNNAATYAQDASYLNDAWATTVMSYFDQTENTYFANQGFTRNFAETPMVADLLAVASLYGPVTTTRTGDTIYGFNNNTGRSVFDAAVGQVGIAFTIIDNGGNDTVDFSGYSSNARLDLNPESFSNVGSFVGNMSIARGTIIENAIGGAGNDTLIGNAADNRLTGNGGTDTFYGGKGNDVFVVDGQGELVFENPGEGTDRVETSANYYLFDNIEQLTLTGAAGIFGVGNALDNLMTGNAAENLLLGGLGNDEIHGGDARDSIFGEDGADTLFGDAGIDYIVGGNGNDTLDGGANPDEMYGQAGDDTLWGGLTFDTDIMVGGDGNDTIHGDSGLGDYDRMYGNLGNDTFYVDTPDDLVFEQPGEGTDTVYALINGAGYYLYDNIENLVLLGNTPFGVGNALNNQLTGSAASNWLLGGGGNDILNGKAGNDVLFGEAGSDTFVFERGTGADVIGDFTRGQDRIDLSAFGFSFAQIQAGFVQNGSDGAINLGSGDIVVLNGVTMSALTAADFILPAAAVAKSAAVASLAAAVIDFGLPDPAGGTFGHTVHHFDLLV